MKRHGKYLATAAMVAVLLALAAPRAVHAVTAALVNVTNTAAGPAIVQSVSQLASQNVFLQAAVAPGDSEVAFRTLPDGSQVSFAVPTGQSLILTTIEITPNAGGASFGLIENQSNGSVREFYNLPPGPYTNMFQYPTGIVFSAGESVKVVNTGITGAALLFNLRGYLTSN
jgi:hypothetical protein